MNDLKKVLMTNGFLEKEALIYLCALEYGEIPIALMAQKTKIKRTTIYNLLDELRTKNIITIQKKKGIQYISATSPAVVIEQFRQSASKAHQALPDLINLAYQSPIKPRINFHEGFEGLQTILREFTQSSSPPFGFTDYGNMPPRLHQFIKKEIIPLRKQKKAWARFILPHNPTNQNIVQQNDLYFSENKVFNFSHNENPTEILLYDHQKTAILSLLPQEPFGLIINSKSVYQTIENIFNLLWDSKP